MPAGGKAQYLDKLQVERERGITVKVAKTRPLAFDAVSSLFPCSSVTRTFFAQMLKFGCIWSTLNTGP